MEEMVFPADAESLYRAVDFVGQYAKQHGFDGELLQIELAVEEVFTNISGYAYGEEGGTVLLTCKTEADSGFYEKLQICFMDTGKPFNPLKQDDPDVTLPADQREIGGLGIFLIKEFMETVSYEYKDGKNILIIEKKRSPLQQEKNALSDDD